MDRCALAFNYRKEKYNCAQAVLIPFAAECGLTEEQAEDALGQAGFEYRVVGDGDIDWRLFFQLYHKYAEGKPFILEYVNEENFREIMRRVNEYDA